MDSEQIQTAQADSISPPREGSPAFPRALHGRLYRVASGGNMFAMAQLRDFERVHPETAIGGDWAEDAAHENGKYQCRCCNCGNLFIGHKRRVTCRTCAESHA